jgi:hypothetical protein
MKLLNQQQKITSDFPPLRLKGMVFLLTKFQAKAIIWKPECFLRWKH